MERSGGRYEADLVTDAVDYSEEAQKQAASRTSSAGPGALDAAVV